MLSMGVEMNVIEKPSCNAALIAEVALVEFCKYNLYWLAYNALP